MSAAVQFPEEYTVSESISPTPADLVITPRDLRVGDVKGSERWWHGGDPAATAFYNALSASFPLGERFFIESVKRFRHCADGRLSRQIDAFVMQESIHSREHIAFNAVATDHGYDLSRIDAFLKQRFQWARSRGALEQLASTIALEHFTAIMAHEALSNPQHFEGTPDSIQRLWRWHAMEEIEHKAVAFDTYLAATRSMSGMRRWLLRCHVMFISTVLFLHEIAFGAREFFRQDNVNTPRMWLRFLRYVFVKPGLMRRVLGAYFSYYRPGFHPWNIDDRGLIREFEASPAGQAMLSAA
jgi:predicted metal-dependent hydrolase